ncbi:MAG: LysR family transcriptional regulator [Planctomycetes bacterium]|nr:LysR family transcriptional regulator [Planctomycetota bacterium]
MTMIWVIGGAGRGVGKTHLALGLCRLLPSSVYAKVGHGQTRPDKPGNFFHTEGELAAFLEQVRGTHEHIVLECNAWVRKQKGDVVIFIESIPGETDERGDAAALAARAQIRIGPRGTMRAWKRVLRPRLGDTALREAVCDLLAAQERFVCRCGPGVRTKVWFVVGGQHAFGTGLARLLENVDELGTLREAAAASRMSYRHAWDLIKTADKHWGKPLLVTQPGGAGGGRSELSSEGRHLLETYQRVNAEVATCADRCAAAALKELDVTR